MELAIQYGHNGHSTYTLWTPDVDSQRMALSTIMRAIFAPRPTLFRILNNIGLPQFALYAEGVMPGEPSDATDSDVFSKVHIIDLTHGSYAEVGTVQVPDFVVGNDISPVVSKVRFVLTGEKTLGYGRVFAQWTQHHEDFAVKVDELTLAVSESTETPFIFVVNDPYAVGPGTIAKRSAQTAAELTSSLLQSMPVADWAVSSKWVNPAEVILDAVVERKMLVAVYQDQDFMYRCTAIRTDTDVRTIVRTLGASVGDRTLASSIVYLASYKPATADLPVAGHFGENAAFYYVSASGKLLPHVVGSDITHVYINADAHRNFIAQCAFIGHLRYNKETSDVLRLFFTAGPYTTKPTCWAYRDVGQATRDVVGCIGLLGTSPLKFPVFRHPIDATRGSLPLYADGTAMLLDMHHNPTLERHFDAADFKM